MSTLESRLAALAKNQEASRQEKVTTGYKKEVVVADEASLTRAEGGLSHAAVTASPKGIDTTFKVVSLFVKDGKGAGEWTPMKNGGEYRQVPCFVSQNGLVTFQTIHETRNVKGRPDVNVVAGNMMVLPAVFVAPKVELWTLLGDKAGADKGKLKFESYENGAWLLTNPYGREASEQELFMLVRERQLVTVNAVIEA